jgi:nucleotide-binding universal stress UspA family protein
MFRDLLVHVDGSDAGRRRVQYAASLAARMDARVRGLHVTPPAEVPPQYMASQIDAVAKGISNGLAVDARASAEIFQQAIGTGAADGAWSEASGDIARGICDQARYADLVIVGQYEWQGSPERHPFPVAHSIIAACGRPVIVVPHDSRLGTTNNVAVIWDDSREAVRAVHDALPLLKIARSVHVVTAGSTGAIHDQTHVQGLIAHLANHGIEVDAYVQQVKGLADLGKMIADEGYDLLVIGGSSRPTWVECIFGSAVQTLLLSSTTPLFVSH